MHELQNHNSSSSTVTVHPRWLKQRSQSNTFDISVHATRWKIKSHSFNITVILWIIACILLVDPEQKVLKSCDVMGRSCWLWSVLCLKGNCYKYACAYTFISFRIKPQQCEELNETSRCFAHWAFVLWLWMWPETQNGKALCVFKYIFNDQLLWINDTSNTYAF